MMRNVQVEITTKCNFGCFYCAGRSMPQRDMALALAESIIDNEAGPDTCVTLQGEGEPVLSKAFWPLVERVFNKGAIPYTITNGGYTINSQMELGFRKYFKGISVSLDSVIPEEAERIGRYRLNVVMENIRHFKAFFGEKNVRIMTVYTSRKNVESVFGFMKAEGLTQQVVQNLQAKDDYMIKYRIERKAPPVYRNKCHFLDTDDFTFYNIDGVKLPCCFIKDATHFTSKEDLKARLEKGDVPPVCGGCREIIKR